MFNQLKRTACLLLTAWLFFIAPAIATTAGPNFPSSGADNSGSGTIAWGTPGNITAQDSSYATCAHTSGTTTGHYLVASGFSLSIPAGATINGITVVVRNKASIGGRASDLLVQLSKDGSTLVGANYGTSTTISTTESDKTYGGAADLWTTTWTDSDLNASTFSVFFQTKSNFGATTVSVNDITVTVDYTGGTVTASPTLIMTGVGN